MSALGRLLPEKADNGFEGHPAALWLLGAFVALKLVMSVRSILDTVAVVTGDGIPLGSYGPAAAHEVLTLFALMALGQLALALIALLIVVRYRALVPALCLLLLAERIAGRLIVWRDALPGDQPAAIVWIMAVLLPALLALALALSLWPWRRRRTMEDAQ